MVTHSYNLRSDTPTSSARTRHSQDVYFQEGSTCWLVRSLARLTASTVGPALELGSTKLRRQFLTSSRFHLVKTRTHRLPGRSSGGASPQPEARAPARPASRPGASSMHLRQGDQCPLPHPHRAGSSREGSGPSAEGNCDSSKGHPGTSPELFPH